MTVTISPRLTADEFFALFPIPGEPRHLQLIDGEIVVGEPRVRHQRLVTYLIIELGLHARAHPELGEAGVPIDMVITDHDVYAPDVWWTTAEHRFDRDALRSYGPTDLAIEVRSPSTWRYDTGIKKDRYEAAGLPELWLIDTETDTVIVHRRSSPDVPTSDVHLVAGLGDTLETPLIPGFALDVSELFDR